MQTRWSAAAASPLRCAGSWLTGLWRCISTSSTWTRPSIWVCSCSTRSRPYCPRSTNTTSSWLARFVVRSLTCWTKTLASNKSRTTPQNTLHSPTVHLPLCKSLTWRKTSSVQPASQCRSLLLATSSRYLQTCCKHLQASSWPAKCSMTFLWSQLTTSSGNQVSLRL